MLERYAHDLRSETEINSYVFEFERESLCSLATFMTASARRMRANDTAVNSYSYMLQHYKGTNFHVNAVKAMKSKIVVSFPC